MAFLQFEGPGACVLSGFSPATLWTIYSLSGSYVLSDWQLIPGVSPPGGCWRELLFDIQEKGESRGSEVRSQIAYKCPL